MVELWHTYRAATFSCAPSIYSEIYRLWWLPLFRETPTRLEQRCISLSERFIFPKMHLRTGRLKGGMSPNQKFASTNPASHPPRNQIWRSKFNYTVSNLSRNGEWLRVCWIPNDIVGSTIRLSLNGTVAIAYSVPLEWSHLPTQMLGPLRMHTWEKVAHPVSDVRPIEQPRRWSAKATDNLPWPEIGVQCARFNFRPVRRKFAPFAEQPRGSQGTLKDRENAVPSATPIVSNFQNGIQFDGRQTLAYFQLQTNNCNLLCGCLWRIPIWFR